MSILEGAVRKHRHLAVIAVVLLAAGVGYDISKTPAMYLDSATVIFSIPKSETAPNAYVSFTPSVIASGAAIAQIMMNPQSQRRIRAAGGTGDYDLALVNLYNEDYPNYSDPAATLTSESLSPAVALRTFKVAAGLLDRLLRVRQAQAGVSSRNLISARIIGNTGPLVQAGSPKRVYGGLALLTVLALSGVRRFARVPGTRDQQPA
jgi:hypothetical protein